MKTEKIDTIKKRFPHQWLLIAVDKVDECTTTPISGKLIAHSPYRDGVYRKLFSLKRRQNILVECSDDRLPKGYAAAFINNFVLHPIPAPPVIRQSMETNPFS